MANEETSGQEPRSGVSWLWLFGGCALSITTLCSLVLAILLVGSTAVNAYLAWTLSGYEVSLSRSTSVSTGVVVSTPASVLAVAPTATATATPTSTPTPVATLSTLEAEFATLSAIATYVAENAPANTPIPPTPTGVASPPPAPTEVTLPPPNPTEVVPSSSDLTEIAPQPPEPAEVVAPAPEVASAPASEVSTASAAAPPSDSKTAAEREASVQSPATSNNSYKLIPIEGGRESRPPDEHADLNLKLRDPQPAPFKASLVDIHNAGSDPNAPQLSAVLKGKIVATYAIHDWDWGSNSKGRLIDDGSAVLAGIKTTPGEPVFIPFKGQDIFQGKYYATLLYASEDSLTFVYTRRGNVVEGYTVHYLGLQVDPNLLKLFRESKGNELPGLTHDVPVGVATDELIVAIRDRGTFMDARSRLDWWK